MVIYNKNNKVSGSSVFCRVVSCCGTLLYDLCIIDSNSENQQIRRRDEGLVEGGFEEGGFGEGGPLQLQFHFYYVHIIF